MRSLRCFCFPSSGCRCSARSMGSSIGGSPSTLRTVVSLPSWRPGAPVNGPAHVSALPSAVLIKMWIYGLVRLTSLFAHPPLWWGALLLALGVISGVLGVAFAIAQHDIKRLLAYHSVENIGIIVMGLGVGVLGRSLGRSDLVVLGLAGAVLHVWNHG